MSARPPLSRSIGLWKGRCHGISKSRYPTPRDVLKRRLAAVRMFRPLPRGATWMLHTPWDLPRSFRLLNWEPARLLFGRMPSSSLWRTEQGVGWLRGGFSARFLLTTWKASNPLNSPGLFVLEAGSKPRLTPESSTRQNRRSYEKSDCSGGLRPPEFTVKNLGLGGS